MKTLRLAISRILTYFSENKTIFVLYFIGTISCVIMMIYYYGNTLNYMTGNSSFDEFDGIVISSDEGCKKPENIMWLSLHQQR